MINNHLKDNFVSQYPIKSIKLKKSYKKKYNAEKLDKNYSFKKPQYSSDFINRQHFTRWTQKILSSKKKTKKKQFQQLYIYVN